LQYFASVHIQGVLQHLPSHNSLTREHHAGALEALLEDVKGQREAADRQLAAARCVSYHRILAESPQLLRSLSMCLYVTESQGTKRLQNSLLSPFFTQFHPMSSESKSCKLLLPIRCMESTMSMMQGSLPTQASLSDLPG
jgi:hypothetical protein